jgi:hypothetical protein
MPIEIQELHIRVAVDTSQNRQAPSNRTTVLGGSQADNESADNKDAIVAECVEQVLQVLQNKAER